MLNFLVESLLLIIATAIVYKFFEYLPVVLILTLFLVTDPRNFFKEFFPKTFAGNSKLTFSESFIKKHYRKN